MRKYLLTAFLFLIFSTAVYGEESVRVSATSYEPPEIINVDKSEWLSIQPEAIADWNAHYGVGNTEQKYSIRAQYSVEDPEIDFSLYADTIQAAGEQLRSQMLERQRTATVYLKYRGELSSQIFRDIAEEAFKENGDYRCGDYLLANYLWYSAKASGFKYTAEDGTVDYYLTYNVSLGYLTTAEQEAEVDAKVQEIASKIKAENRTVYDRCAAIHDYLIETVEYNNDAAAEVGKSVKDIIYKTPHSAYGALIERSAVCDGYAAAYYRIANSVGIPTRIATGTSGNTGHAWNITNIDGKHYGVDVTFDDNGVAAMPTFLLVGSYTFNLQHIQDETSEERLVACILSDTNYTTTGIPCSSHEWDVDVKLCTKDHDGSITFFCLSCATEHVQTFRQIGKVEITPYVNGVLSPVVKAYDVDGNPLSPSLWDMSHTQDVGLNAVTVRFKSYYFGYFYEYFIIKPEGTSLRSVTSPEKSCVTARWNKKKYTGYQIQYSTSSKFPAASRKSKYCKTEKITVKNLKSNKTYYFRVRAYKEIDETKYYSEWSKVKKIHVK